MRSLSANLKSDQMMASYARDFTLYEVGYCSTESAEITPTEIHHVCEVADLIEEETDGPTQSTRLEEVS